MKTNIYLILTLVSLMSCKSAVNKKTLWVNSSKVACVGVGPMQCLQVKFNASENWSNFYDAIEGFEYQPGFVYELEVQVDTLDKANLPADKSIYVYKLLNVISKKQDAKLRLNDIWVATHIENKELSRVEPMPQIELSLKTMQLMGTDGCNNIRGSIKTLTDDAISFGPLLGTKKLCPNMTTPNAFNTAFEGVTSYKLDQLQLMFFDNANKEVIRFKKVD
jgi:heat shock protein HslJ